MIPFGGLAGLSGPMVVPDVLSRARLGLGVEAVGLPASHTTVGAGERLTDPPMV